MTTQQVHELKSRVQSLFEEFDNSRVQTKTETYPVWHCSDGRVLKVSEMATPHIKNCITLIENGELGFRKRYLPIFREELSKRKRSYGSDFDVDKTTTLKEIGRTLKHLGNLLENL